MQSDTLFMMKKGGSAIMSWSTCGVFAYDSAGVSFFIIKLAFERLLHFDAQKEMPMTLKTVPIHPRGQRGVHR